MVKENELNKMIKIGIIMLIIIVLIALLKSERHKSEALEVNFQESTQLIYESFAEISVNGILSKESKAKLRNKLDEKYPESTIKTNENIAGYGGEVFLEVSIKKKNIKGEVEVLKEINMKGERKE